MIALIGSRALKHHFDDFRDPIDWDLVISNDELLTIEKQIGGTWRYKRENHYVCRHGNKTIEVWVAKPKNSEQLILDSCSEEIKTPFGNVFLPSIEALCAVKRAHLYWPYHWEKHIKDYHFLLAKGINFDKKIFKLRKKEHEERLGKNHINLKMKNCDFFAKSQPMVQRVFDHDSLHYATCYYDKPLYKQCKHNPELATIDEDLFNKLCHSDKLRMVKEECYALSLEREIIPIITHWRDMENSNLISKRTMESAYSKWLMKLATSVSRGWFREFVIENWPSIKYPDKDYVDEFLKTAENGRIKLYGPSNYIDGSISDYFKLLRKHRRAALKQN